MNQTFGKEPLSGTPQFTRLQGQYLTFSYAYTRIFKRSPAEADMRRHFQVTAPFVHQMVITLEKPVSFSVNLEKHAAFNCSSSQKLCPSCGNSTGQNLWGAVLVRNQIGSTYQSSIRNPTFMTT